MLKSVTIVHAPGCCWQGVYDHAGNLVHEDFNAVSDLDAFSRLMRAVGYRVALAAVSQEWLRDAGGSLPQHLRDVPGSTHANRQWRAA